MSLRVLGVLLAAVSAATPAAAEAQHRAAIFDLHRELSIEGVVTRYDWKNPRVYIGLRTAATAGGATHDQGIEAAAASMLLPFGLTKDSLHPGDRVAVQVSPNRDGAGGIALGREVVTADGRVLPLSISPDSLRKPITRRAKGLAGTWVAPPQGYFDLTASRHDWPLTEAGRKALGALEEPGPAPVLHAECLPVTAPALMFYPVVRTIEVTEETIVFNVDWMQSKRIVHMDGRAPAGGAPLPQGRSVGHWEGNTLVVDTMWSANEREGRTPGLPSGPRRRLVERLSLTQDARHINYKAALEDPDYLAAPVTLRSQWEYRPDLEPTGLGCGPDAARRDLTDE